ncbi:MAG: ParB/RepB/Spo0J family partition protein [Cardiobacteriaceae bacterium]|nr:ParB/RepB/Spo0J family partition protein [Cardiobacteriaceae bacterium]
MKNDMNKNKKRALRHGLDALLSGVGQEALHQPDFEVLKQIDVGRIRAGVYQPRRRFDEEALNELARSIAEHGILQPLVVRPVGDEKYEIIAGERRFRAGQQAGLAKFPCVVKHYDDRQALAVALIENLQRSDLNALEVAQGLHRLAKDFSLTHDNIAQLVGRSRSAVSNTLRLLELSEPVKKALGDDRIEMGHARALLSLPDAQQQAVLNEIMARHLTVRQTEARVRALHEGAPAKMAPERSVDIDALEQRISEFMSASVSLQHQKKGNGKLILKYRDLDELDSILAKWGIK